jgi:hypothetical protein
MKVFVDISLNRSFSYALGTVFSYRFINSGFFKYDFLPGLILSAALFAIFIFIHRAYSELLVGRKIFGITSKIFLTIFIIGVFISIYEVYESYNIV